MRGSEVRFTLGNHDIETLSKRDHLTHYIHEKAIDSDDGFFHDDLYIGKTETEKEERSLNIRKECLKPFYECCPYFLLSIGDEIICVHAGLHDPKIGNMLNITTIKIQTDIQDDITNFDKSLIDDKLIFKNDNGPLWTRFYSQGDYSSKKFSSKDVCDKINELKYDLTVVGHCPTANDDSFKHHNEIIEKYKKTNKNMNCNKGGCVLLGCNDKPDEGPHLAFVDIGMSSAFGGKLDKPAEFLLLEHNDSLSSTPRYYNQISRVKVDDKRSVIPMWKIKKNSVIPNRLARPQVGNILGKIGGPLP
jgi:hypothetical protein